MYLLVIAGLGCFLGLLVGRHLLRRGITGNMDLSRYQKQIYLGLVLCVSIGIILALIKRFRLIHWLPVWLLLLVGELPIFGLFFSWFVVGILVRLCLANQHKGLILVGLLSMVLSWQMHWHWPITHLVQTPSATREQVVLQSTPYSCGAASVATLARLYGRMPEIGEREVISLTATSRRGTTTFREWWTLFYLGLRPQYRVRLTLDDLIKANRPALLHVYEPVGQGETILHAVVLLAIEPQKQKVIIGNPLYGRQEKSFAEMETYWTKEAIFITPKSAHFS